MCTFVVHVCLTARALRNLLVVVNHFSKYAWTRLLRTKESAGVVAHLVETFEAEGPPRVLLTDNGSEFVNHEVEALLSSREVRMHHGQPYHPQTQGAVERLNQTLKAKLRLAATSVVRESGRAIRSAADAEAVVRLVTVLYNGTCHSTTNEVRFALTLRARTRLIFAVTRGLVLGELRFLGAGTRAAP